MTVGELILQLEEYPPDTLVWADTRDAEYLVHDVQSRERRVHRLTGKTDEYEDAVLLLRLHWKKDAQGGVEPKYEE